jgi:hypothetical protein
MVDFFHSKVEKISDKKTFSVTEEKQIYFDIIKEVACSKCLTTKSKYKFLKYPRNSNTLGLVYNTW